MLDYRCSCSSGYTGKNCSVGKELGLIKTFYTSNVPRKRKEGSDKNKNENIDVTLLALTKNQFVNTRQINSGYLFNKVPHPHAVPSKYI